MTRIKATFHSRSVGAGSCEPVISIDSHGNRMAVIVDAQLGDRGYDYSPCAGAFLLDRSAALDLVEQISAWLAVTGSPS